MTNNVGGMLEWGCIRYDGNQSLEYATMLSHWAVKKVKSRQRTQKNAKNYLTWGKIRIKFEYYFARQVVIPVIFTDIQRVKTSFFDKSNSVCFV